MKKVTLILTAIALVFGMVQCKKEKVEQSAPTEEVLGNPVHITVKVGDNGKHIVHPYAGLYLFEGGDLLYVGHAQRYVGTLTYNKSIGAFEGDVYADPRFEDNLHFYFVGGLAPQNITAFTGNTSNDLTANNTSTFEVNISNQFDKLPVLAYGCSKEKYTGSGGYNCTLLNKCALVEFKFTNEVYSNLYVDNMLVQAKVDFANPAAAITPVAGSTGSISLYVDVDDFTSKWAILLPQDEHSSTMTSQSQSTIFNFTVDVPQTENNAFFHGTSALSVPQPSYQGLLLSGKFSIASNKQCQFSCGNLQYARLGANGEWSFMSPQWKIVEKDGDDVGEDYANRDTVSIFFWGRCDMPFETTFPGDPYSFTDWGTYAASDIGEGWRTLTSEEWRYLFQSRQDANKKFGLGCVNGVNGLILLPDEWSGGDIVSGVGSYNNNVLGVGDWIVMENAGAVFLPAAGSRSGTSISYVGRDGNYHSSTKYNSSASSNMGFSQNAIYPGTNTTLFFGNASVRLVKDVN